MIVSFFVLFVLIIIGWHVIGVRIVRLRRMYRRLAILTRVLLIFRGILVIGGHVVVSVVVVGGRSSRGRGVLFSSSSRTCRCLGARAFLHFFPARNTKFSISYCPPYTSNGFLPLFSTIRPSLNSATQLLSRFLVLSFKCFSSK